MFTEKAGMFSFFIILFIYLKNFLRSLSSPVAVNCIGYLTMFYFKQSDLRGPIPTFFRCSKKVVTQTRQVGTIYPLG